MSWKITKVFVDPSDVVSFELTNVSGGSLDTADFFLRASFNSDDIYITTLSFSSYGGTGTVPDGGTIIVGDLRAANVSGSTTQVTWSNVDTFTITDTSLNVIDSVGDLDAGTAPWVTNTIFTADPGRMADTNDDDAFSFATDFTSSTFCFAAGTRIATPDGEKRVEHMQIGDLVRTADGRAVAVKWLGHQTLSKLRHGPHMQPVRIRAGALGNGLPHTDLTVTADHGMIIDDLVINASALVNGTTIDWVPMAELEDSFTVYHIETENHDVIFASGALSETFVDSVTRQSFDNYQEYLDLYGAERIIPEMPRARISARRMVPPQIKKRLGIEDRNTEYAEALSA